MNTFSPSWNSPPASWILSSQLDIWCASLNVSPARLTSFHGTLSPDERARAERYYFQIDRDRFVAGRGILRSVLGRYLHASPDSIQFHYGAYGKPALDDNLRFNVSHSQGLALIAITQRRCVGIDLEYIRDDVAVQELVTRFFSPEERMAFQAIPANEQQKVFFTFWTRKEAYLKAQGLSISLLENEDAQRRNDVGWAVTELRPAEGYAAAVVIESDVAQVNYWQWEE